MDEQQEPQSAEETTEVPPPPPPRLQYPLPTGEREGIWSIVLGVLGLVSCGLLSLAGLKYGEVALEEAKAAGSKRGKILAIIGLSVSGFFVACLILALLSVFFHHDPSPRKAQEATLAADLHQLRNAIALFQADTNVYPTRLEDLVAPDESKLKTHVKKDSYKGPYLTVSGGINNTGLPHNPFAGASTTIEQNWTYSPKDGTVRSAVTGVTLDGVPYEKL